MLFLFYHSFKEKKLFQPYESHFQFYQENADGYGDLYCDQHHYHLIFPVCGYIVFLIYELGQ